MAGNNGLTRELMAMRAAQELEDGMCVNLGTGLPDIIPDFFNGEKEILFHSENGVLGIKGITDDENKWDRDLTNVTGFPVNLVPGASCFDCCLSFGIMRGGHLDVTIVGAYQVSEKGDIANWKLSGQKAGSPGGAMDLVVGAKKVIVLMNHVERDGSPKILKYCSLAFTGKEVVDVIITNLAVINVTSEGLVLRETAPGVTPEEVQSSTEPALIINDKTREMNL